MFDQKRLTGSNLIRLRIAILGRPAFDHVSDVHILPPQLHAFSNDFGEQLPGPADKRLAFQIFVTSGRLANKDEFGPWVTRAKNDLGAPLAELAAATVAYFSAQFLKRLYGLQSGREKQVPGLEHDRRHGRLRPGGGRRG